MSEINFNKDLIRIIKDYPNLYDKSLPLYHVNEKRKEAWENIVFKMISNVEYNTTIRQVKNRWKELTQEYSQYRATRKQNSSGFACQPTAEDWLYYNDFNFLDALDAHQEAGETFFCPNDEDENKVANAEVDDENINNASDKEDNDDNVNDYSLSRILKLFAKVPKKRQKKTFFKILKVIHQNKFQPEE